MTSQRGLKAVSVCALLTVAASRLVVYGPQELKDKFEYSDFKINANYANFGNIPYGQSLIGRIYYNASNANGCSRSNFTNDFSGDPDGILTPIFLVDRGHCTFVEKVRNVEHAGGSLAVIIDDSAEDISKVIMSDDGTGTGIRIPAMIIGKKEGQILKDFLTKQPIELIRKASLAAEFIMQTDDKVNYEIWYTSTNDKALDFIRNFKDHHIGLNDAVSFKPRIVTWSCTSCDSDFKKKECFSNGRYCANNHKGTYIQGRDILMEDLREVCLHQLVKAEGQDDLWWQYMQFVHRMCYEEITEDCSKLGHKAINRDYQKTLDCVKNSFEGPNDQKDDNRILKVASQDWKQYGSAYWPSVMINQRTYRGDLVPDSVLNALCAGFSKEPSYCSRNNDLKQIYQPEGITGNVLIFIVGFLVLINLVMIFLYRKCANREIKQDMQLQVNSAVSQYFALSQRNNSTLP